MDKLALKIFNALNLDSQEDLNTICVVVYKYLEEQKVSDKQ